MSLNYCGSSTGKPNKGVCSKTSSGGKNRQTECRALLREGSGEGRGFTHNFLIVVAKKKTARREGELDSPREKGHSPRESIATEERPQGRYDGISHGGGGKKRRGGGAIVMIQKKGPLGPHL